MTLTAPAPVTTAVNSPEKSGNTACAAILTAAGAAGAAALVTADRAAEWGRDPFGWFWLGMLVFTLPAVWWAGRRATGPLLRVAVLVAYACFSYLPKLLRNPTG